MATKSAFEMSFVRTKSAIPTVELDTDSLPEQVNDWGEIVSHALARFAQSNPTVKATIYNYFTQSVNFHAHTNSESFGVAGTSKKSVLKAIYDEFNAIPGVKVRFGDHIAAEHQKYHIEDGVAWEAQDAATWNSIAVESEQNTDSNEDLDELPEGEWPPKPTFNFYDGIGNRFLESSDEDLDFADTLMQFWDEPFRAVTFGLSTVSKKWRWTEENLRLIERLIKDDLEFDGYYVTTVRCMPAVGRHSPDTSEPLSEIQEFRWVLFITNYPQNPTQEDIDAEWILPNSQTKAKPLRSRKARKNANVGSIRSTVEKMLGLPDGSVAFCNPDGSHLKANAKIATLRKRWE